MADEELKAAEPVEEPAKQETPAAEPEPAPKAEVAAPKPETPKQERAQQPPQKREERDDKPREDKRGEQRDRGPRPGGGGRPDNRGGERGGDRGDRGDRRGGPGGERGRGGPGGGRPFEGPADIELEKLIADSLYLDNQAHAVVARMRDMDSGTKSQLRRLYNAVRRAVRAPESERQHQFVMLRARLAYTIARHSLRSLDALERLLLQVTRKNDARGYERFKDLFEAIVAYNE